MGGEFKVMMLQEAYLQGSILMDTPEQVVPYVESLLPDCIRYKPEVENMGIIPLNTRRRCIGMEIMAQGTIDTLLVVPRDIFRAAIVLNAAAVILWHNHPSGDPTPSEADISVTHDLIRAGQLMKIEILDHIIIGHRTPERPKHWNSLRELGYFYS